MRKQFRDTLMELDNTALILGGVSNYLFKEYQEKYPDRFYDLGICEQTMISVAAGLASRGINVFVHTIAPFLIERAYEQIKLDVCYNKFPVNIISCGASFDYAWDGPTHHSYNDLELMRLLPGMEVIQPGSNIELASFLRQTYDNGNPTYIRLSDHPFEGGGEYRVGSGITVRSMPSDLVVVSSGPLASDVGKACNGTDASFLYFPSIKPFDAELLQHYSEKRVLVVSDSRGLFEAVTACGVKA